MYRIPTVGIKGSQVCYYYLKVKDVLDSIQYLARLLYFNDSAFPAIRKDAVDTVQ